MGQYDAIKAAASNNMPLQTDYSSSNSTRYATVPSTVTRLPGESYSDYMHRVGLVQQRMDYARLRQEVIEKRQKELQEREEQREARIRQENTETAEKLYAAAFKSYNPNDVDSLRNTKGLLGELKNFYTFNKLNKDFDMYVVDKANKQNNWRIANLEKGEQNKSYVDKSGYNSSKNYLASEFQPAGSRDIIC